MKTTLGEFIALKRKEKGLTQKELAEKLFVSESAVSKWEQNRSNPDISVLPILSDILEVTEHELVTASVDHLQREKNKKAKKWEHLSLAWNLFFYISYGITVLTCFIVNLAVSGTLSWFWIVLCSLLFAATFTTLPQFVEKHKILILPLASLSSLLLLLGAICLFVRGNWFFVSASPIVLSFLFFFLPLYMKRYILPVFIRKHAALLTLLCLFLATMAMMYIIEGFSDGNWANQVALPIVGAVTAVVALAIASATYPPVNLLLRGGFVLSVCSLFYYPLFVLVEEILYRNFAAPKQGCFPIDITRWYDPYLNNNIQFFIVLTLAVSALTCLGFGIAKQIKNKK